MKVLWLVNTIFPYPAQQMGYDNTVFGGWAKSLYNSLQKTDEITSFCIVATYKGKYLKKFVDGNTIYYLIPTKNDNKYNYKSKKDWQLIIDDFKPDIVHIHGTEYPKSLPLIELYPSLNYVVSIQGFLNSYKRVCYGNVLFSTLIKNITIRDILKPRTGYLIKLDYEKRAKYEYEIIKKVKNVIGRTDWDKAQVLAINPNIHYYHGEENLRESFFSGQWDIKKINKHTIFFSQAQAILKGFSIMIEALKILKVKYPDVKIVVAGNNILDTSTFKSRIKRQSYTKYLQKLIKKYNLNNDIEFTGFLNEKEYKEKLLLSHVYVQASSIENSSNSLGEAMILGVPCVASNVGGTSSMLIDKKEGLLYPYTEPELLAYYIDNLFDSPELCKELSKNAKVHAQNRHNWDNNAKTTIECYRDIINEDNKNENYQKNK